MTTPYVDPQTVHNPVTGTSPPASWGDTVRDDLEFLARPAGCVLQTSSAQNTTSSSWLTGVAWNGSDLRDTDGFHAPSSDQIVIPAGLGGWYHLSGSIVWEPNSVGLRAVRYTIDGAGDYRLAVAIAASGVLGTRVAFAEDVELAAGEVLRIGTLQNSGSTLPLATSCKLSVRLVAVT